MRLLRTFVVAVVAVEVFVAAFGFPVGLSRSPGGVVEESFSARCLNSAGPGLIR